MLADDGTVFFLTPNAPADFENPFHIHLFEPPELRDCSAGTSTTSPCRASTPSPTSRPTSPPAGSRPRRCWPLDVFDLRHRIPRSWYVGAYTRVLPDGLPAHRPGRRREATGITADDFFVTDELDPTTMVLFATASRPGRSG